MTVTQFRLLRLLARPDAYAYRDEGSVLWSIGTPRERWRKTNSTTLMALARQGLIVPSGDRQTWTITPRGRQVSASGAKDPRDEESYVD